MEQFKNGAYQYFKVSIRSDRPDEICFQIFNKDTSKPMERCGLTATMGNYERLRLLYLKNKIVDSRVLYKGFDKIDFIEKDQYPSTALWRQNDGSYMVFAAPSESFVQLASWPQDSVYYKRWNWRYRPFFKVTQYWRKEAPINDSSLKVRVNGRARYWAGGSNNPRNYISIPGGVAFENFELRDKYVPGQKFYYGISRKNAEEMLKTVH